jgi:3' exoribonuclease, RNase T-like
MRHIMFDIETTDVESSAACLSVAQIEFTLEEIPNYQDLLKRATFVKFNVADQIKNYHRTVDAATMDWWKKRPQIIREVSLLPKPTDLSLVDGLEILRATAGLDTNPRKNRDLRFWQRGGLDQLVFESLCRACGQQPFIHFSSWRDVRTTVELVCEGAVDGYVEVPGLPQDWVQKHHPVHDCAYDICQMLVNNIKSS